MINKSKILEINQPYYSAGKKYGWPGRTVGIGIKSNLLEGNGDIKLKVGKNPTIYGIMKENARKLAEKYQSYYWVRQTKLSIIPWQEFIRVEVEKNDLVSEKGKQISQQQFPI